MNNVSCVEENCLGCGVCKLVCPQNAINIEYDLEGFLHPFIDSSKCINCGLCLTGCAGHKTFIFDKKYKDCYGAASSDLKIKLKSSSGGVFYLLAKEIIKRKGVVYGSSFFGGVNAKHIRVDSIEQIDHLLSSKYLQSDLSYTFIDCKRDLESGKDVLYTGTPCQIAALYAFLKQEYKNLITQQIVCHGVPSFKVWTNWIHEMEKKYKSKLDGVNFRTKRSGWINGLIEYKFSNKKVFVPKSKDPYFIGFNYGLFLRKCCYSCKYKEKNSPADISLGDFWAVNEIAPILNDNMGTSLIIIHSDKGRALFECIKKELMYLPVNYDYVLSRHDMIVNSSKTLEERALFFEKYDGNELRRTVKKCIPKKTLQFRIQRKLRSFIKA